MVGRLWLISSWVMWKYGDRLRNISPMALHDDELDRLRAEQSEKIMEDVPASQLADVEQRDREGGAGRSAVSSG